MAEAVVNEADVRAPALVADDGAKLFLARPGLPQLLKVATERAQVGELPAQLAGAEVAVVVNLDGSPAGRAGHGRGVRGLDVFELDFIVESQRPLVVNLGGFSLDSLRAPERGGRVVRVNFLELPVERWESLDRDFLQARVRRVAPDDVEVVTVHRAAGLDELGDLEDVVEILRADYGVNVDAQVREPLPARLNGFERFERLLEIAGDGADRVLHLAEAVEGDVQVEAQFGVFGQNSPHPLGRPPRQQAVRRQVHPPDAVVRVKEPDNFGKLFAQHGLAAGEPEVGEIRHRPGKFLDFVPGQVALLVEFFPIKTSPALGIADGGDEENYQLEAPLGGKPLIDFPEFRLVVHRCHAAIFRDWPRRFYQIRSDQGLKSGRFSNGRDGLAAPGAGARALRQGAGQ